MRIVFASLALALAVPAAAQDLTWKWEEGQHRRYFLQAGIKFQANWPMGAEIRWDFMAQDLLLTAVADCEATRLKKKRTFITCTLEDVGILAGVGNATGGETVQNVVDEWDEKLTGATYHTSITLDGRIGPGELDGIEFRSMNQRTNKITASMEAIVDRLFSTLDVGLPKPGSSWQDGWVAKNQMSLMIPTTSGGNGMNKVEYSVDGTEGTHIDATAIGDGTIMEGIDVPKAYAFESKSIMRFDHEAGTLLAHVYQSEGNLTASSVSLPGRAQGEAQRSTSSGMGSLGGGSQGSRDLGSASAMGDGTGGSMGFLRGGAYDPNQYLEAGRMYLLGEGEEADVGPTGPMLYPTGAASDPAAGDPPAEPAPAQE